MEGARRVYKESEGKDDISRNTASFRHSIMLLLTAFYLFQFKDNTKEATKTAEKLSKTIVEALKRVKSTLGENSGDFEKTWSGIREAMQSRWQGIWDKLEKVLNKEKKEQKQQQQRTKKQSSKRHHAKPKAKHYEDEIDSERVGKAYTSWSKAKTERRRQAKDGSTKKEVKVESKKDEELKSSNNRWSFETLEIPSSGDDVADNAVVGGKSNSSHWLFRRAKIRQEHREESKR